MKDSPGGSSILAFSENNIFAGGYHFDGTSWTHVLQGPFYIEDFWAAAEDDIFAVGFERKSPPDYAKSRIFHYDGVEWTEMENNFKTLLHGVWGSSSSDVFAVGPEKYDDSSDDGTIYHYDGESWSVMLDGAPSGLYGVWGSSANDVFVGGGRLILHYDGIEWSEMENPGGSYLDIWGVSPTEVYAAGYATGGWHFRYYDGNEWICMGKNLEGSYDAIWGSSVTDVFAVGVVLRDFNPVGIIAEYVCDEPGLSKRP